MSVTKKVETTLKDSIEKTQGHPLPPRTSGIKLLDYALGCHLIKSKGDPLYSLLYWLLKEPRNTSHHEFIVYPYNSLVQFMLEANAAIQKTKDRIGTSYSGSFVLFFDPEKKTIEVNDVKVWRPNQIPLPSDQKVEATFKFSNGSMKTLPLRPNGGSSWKEKYDARGESAGTVWVGLRGVNHGKRFLVPSGSTTYLSPQIGETCPYCGHKLEFRGSICPNCGSRLYV